MQILQTLCLITVLLISLFNLVEFTAASEKEAECEAHDGRSVTHGMLYIPGPNMCSFCVCYHGEPMWCQMIFCPGPPFKTCLEWENGRECCEFRCLRPIVNNTSTQETSDTALAFMIAAMALLF